MNFKVAVVLPAGGIGERMGMPTPKQYCKVLNRPLVSYTIEAFERIPWIGCIVVCVSTDRVEYMQQLLKECGHSKTIVTLGDSARHRSIRNGIRHLANSAKEPDVVVIHDAVRPFVDEQIVKEVASAANEHGAAGAIRPLVSTVIGTDMDGFLDHSLERIKYRASEMPQAFQYSLIRAAYDKCTDYDLDYGTECLHLAQKYMGSKVRLIEGPVNLWKVTHKKDLYAAEAMLKEQLNKTVIVFGTCGGDTQQKLHEAFSKFEIEVYFCGDVKDIDKSKLKTSNFIVYSTNCDLTEVNPAIRHLEITTDNPQSQLDDKSQKSESSFHRHNPETLHKTRKQGGTVLCIIDNSAEVKTDSLRSVIREKSIELKDKGICLNAIVNQTEQTGEWCEIACSLIYNRNLLYSGQVFIT